MVKSNTAWNVIITIVLWFKIDGLNLPYSMVNISFFTLLYLQFEICKFCISLNVKLEIVKCESYYHMCNFYIPCYATLASVQLQNQHLIRCRDKVFHIMKSPFHAHGVHSTACQFCMSGNV